MKFISLNSNVLKRVVFFILFSSAVTGLICSITSGSKYMNIAFYWLIWFAGLFFGLMFGIAERFSRNEVATFASACAVANFLALSVYILIDDVFFIYDKTSLYYLIPGGIGSLMLLSLVSVSLEYTFSLRKFLVFFLIGSLLGWLTINIADESLRTLLQPFDYNRLIVFIGTSMAYLVWQLPIGLMLSSYLHNDSSSYTFQYRKTINIILNTIGVVVTLLGIMNVIWRLILVW